MVEILELPEVRKRLSPLSVEEYHRLGEFNEKGRRTELIRGFVIEKMSKSPLHRTIASLLYRLLVAQLPEGFPALDRENASLYAEAGVAEYWIVLGNQRLLEVYRRPANGRYQENFQVGVNDTLECSAIPGLRLKIAELLA